MRVFITGIAGFLGSHLAETFLKSGWEVAGNDNLIGGLVDNVPEGAEFSEVDCTEWEDMVKVIRGSDVVYHCAALPPEGLSVFSPAIVSKHIYQATATVLSAAISTGVNRFIFCSSMARYGTNKVPFIESMETRPQDPYAIAKVASETLIRLLAQVHGFEYVIAVPHNIYGPKQKYDDPFRNVAAIFINRMLKGQQPYIYGDGRQRRCFSYIQDVIPPLQTMATKEDISGEVINIGPDNEFITILELAEAIAKILSFELQPIYLTSRPQEVIDANCSANKAHTILNYSTRYSLEEGLAEMIDWIRRRGTLPFDYHVEIEIVSDKTPVAWTEKLFNVSGIKDKKCTKT